MVGCLLLYEMHEPSVCITLFVPPFPSPSAFSSTFPTHRPPTPYPFTLYLLPPHLLIFAAAACQLSRQTAVFISILQNWILMNSAMNNQARNYFPISSHDIPPSLCISGINTWSVLEMLHQVMQDLIRSLKFSASQVWERNRVFFLLFNLEKKN